MPHAYTEGQFVGQPAIGLFAKPGWTTVSALEPLNLARPPKDNIPTVDSCPAVESRKMP